MRLLKEAATGNFVPAAKAELPIEPILPQHTRDLMIGILIGFVLGVGAVVLLEQLDVRIHTVDDMSLLLGLPVIGRLPHRRDKAKDSLATLSEPSGPVAEAFRMLRGNLEFVDVDDEVKAIVFSSATQGEGKTTTLCNLALTLARAGKRVLIADCDLRAAARPQLSRSVESRWHDRRW